MQTISDWLKSPEVKKLKAMNDGDFYGTFFNRDPMRAIYVDYSVFYSPADGVILYAKDEVMPTESIIEVKGRNFTVQDLLSDYNYRYPSLVIGIFMTKYSVHVNRSPTRGFINQIRTTPFLCTPNISMVMEENDILDKKPDPKDMGYLFHNERCVSEVYCPDIRGNYFIVQVAEKDVNEIVNWGEGEFFQQAERFGLLRFGSQVDLVIPLTGRVDYESLIPEKMVVEAGIDALVKIKPRKQWMNQH